MIQQIHTRKNGRLHRGKLWNSNVIFCVGVVPKVMEQDFPSIKEPPANSEICILKTTAVPPSNDVVVTPPSVEPPGKASPILSLPLNGTPSTGVVT